MERPYCFIDFSPSTLKTLKKIYLEENLTRDELKTIFTFLLSDVKDPDKWIDIIIDKHVAYNDAQIHLMGMEHMVDVVMLLIKEIRGGATPS